MSEKKEHPEMETFADRLKKVRSESGLSQRAFAKQLNVVFQSVQHWESGRSTPRGKRLTSLSEILHVRAEWLVFGTGEKRKLSGVQKRIGIALQNQCMMPFDLADACHGSIACETIEAWLLGISEPAQEHVEMIAEPLASTQDWLKSGLIVVKENGKEVYSNKQEYGVTQWERDAIEALRRMDDKGRRRALQNLEDGAELADLKRQVK